MGTRPRHHRRYQAVEDGGQRGAGITNIAQFLRPHRDVCVRAVAAAIHQGRSQRLWQVELSRRDAGELAARGQVHLQTREG